MDARLSLLRSQAVAVCLKNAALRQFGAIVAVKKKLTADD
jgi:hypothetical protein